MVDGAKSHPVRMDTESVGGLARREVVFWTTDADMTRSRILAILDAQNKVQFADR